MIGTSRRFHCSSAGELALTCPRGPSALRATTGWTSTGGARSRSVPCTRVAAEHKPLVQSTRRQARAEIAPARRPGISVVKCAISTCAGVVHNREIVVPLRDCAVDSCAMNTLTRVLITTFPLLCAVGVAAPAAGHPAPVCAVLAQPPGDGEVVSPPSRAAAPGSVPPAPPPPGEKAAPGPVVVIVVPGPLAPRPTGVGAAGSPCATAGTEGGVDAGIPAGCGGVEGPVDGSERVPVRRPGSCGKAPILRPGQMPKGALVPAPVPVRVTVHDLGSAAPAQQRARPEKDRGSAPELEIRVRGGSGSAADLPAALRELVRVLVPQRVPAPRPHR